MRYFLFYCLISVSCNADDKLLLPDSITPETESTNHTQAYIRVDKSQPKITAADAAALVEKEFSGQVMSVTLQDSTDHNVMSYSVKILKNGYMKTIYVDANTGNFSKLAD